MQETGVYNVSIASTTFLIGEERVWPWFPLQVVMRKYYYSYYLACVFHFIYIYYVTDVRTYVLQAYGL